MTTAVATFERDLPVTTTPAIRELTREELEEVKGGAIPLAPIVVGVITGLLGYVLGRESAQSNSSATATAHNGSVECNCQCGASSENS